MAEKCPTHSLRSRGTPLYSLADDLSDVCPDGCNGVYDVFDYEDAIGYVCYTKEEIGSAAAGGNPFQQPCNSGDYETLDERMGCVRETLDVSETEAALLAALDAEVSPSITVGVDAIYSSLRDLDENGFLDILTFGVSSTDIETASSYIQDGDVGVFYEWLELEGGTSQARYYAVTNNIGPTISIDSKTTYTEIKVTLDSAENLKLQARFGNIEGGDASTIIATKLDEMAQEIIGASVENRDSFKIITTKPFSQKNLSTLAASTESGTTITGITSTSTTMGGSY